MSFSDPQDPLFRWSEDGIGLRVNASDQDFQQETAFENELVEARAGRVFLGQAISGSRFTLATFVALSCSALLLGRAFWMQIVQGQMFAKQAEENRLRHEIVPARRGIIRDRHQTILAENVPSFDLRVIPQLLPKDKSLREERLGEVGRQIGMDVSEMSALIASSTQPAQEMTLARDIPYDRAVAATILLGDDPAMYIVTGSKRRYPLSPSIPSLSHVLGYAGTVSPDDLKRTDARYRQTDIIGKAGVESSAESLLRGVAGEHVYEVDALNHVTSFVGDTPALDGQDVTLTLDVNLQKAAEQSMQRIMSQYHLSRGSVVALDPRDGSILALVSWPSYDNNVFSGTVSSTLYKALVNDEQHPLLPRAWAGVFPSGSTIKPLYATAALTEHVITPNTTVMSVGGIHIGQSFFPDWKAGGHGATNVRRAIAWSVNTFFYYIGGGYNGFIGLGVDRLSNWLHRFGLGAKMGIDLPGEGTGFVPSAKWKEETKHEHWYIGDTYNLSIGQGDLLVTPLQIATITGEIANGGHKIQPHVIQTGHATTTQPMLDVDPDAVQTVRLGMRDTVSYGSGRALASFPVPVSGKTGTAQWRKDRPTHAWFTSFAPFETPEIVVTVLFEEGGEGSTVSVPVAKDVLQAWYQERGAK